MIGCVAHSYSDLLAAVLWTLAGGWLVFVVLRRRPKSDFDDLLEHLPRGTVLEYDMSPLELFPVRRPPYDWSREEGRTETKGTPPDRTSR